MTEEKEVRRNKKGEIIPQATSDHMRHVVNERWKKQRNEKQEEGPIISESNLRICDNYAIEEKFIQRAMADRGITRQQASVLFAEFKAEADAQTEIIRRNNQIELGAKLAVDHPLAAAGIYLALNYADFDFSSIQHKIKIATRNTPDYHL